METEREMEWSPTTGTIASRARHFILEFHIYDDLLLLFHVYFVVASISSWIHLVIYGLWRVCCAVGWPLFWRLHDNRKRSPPLHTAHMRHNLLFVLLPFYSPMRGQQMNFIMKKKTAAMKGAHLPPHMNVSSSEFIEFEKNAFQTAWA